MAAKLGPYENLTKTNIGSLSVLMFRKHTFVFLRMGGSPNLSPDRKFDKVFAGNFPLQHFVQILFRQCLNQLLTF